MHRVLRSLAAFVPVLALVGVALAGTAGAGAAAPAGPALTAAAPVAGTRSAIAVAGTAFTPGGRVYVALYDVWGARLYATRWAAASPTAYGRDGSQDPAAGFGRGGALAERLDLPCGAAALARACDATTARWSNWLDVGDAGSSAARYGTPPASNP